MTNKQIATRVKGLIAKRVPHGTQITVKVTSNEGNPHPTGIVTLKPRKGGKPLNQTDIQGQDESGLSIAFMDDGAIEWTQNITLNKDQGAAKDAAKGAAKDAAKGAAKDAAKGAAKDAAKGAAKPVSRLTIPTMVPVPSCLSAPKTTVPGSGGAAIKTYALLSWARLVMAEAAEGRGIPTGAIASAHVRKELGGDSCYVSLGTISSWVAAWNRIGNPSYRGGKVDGTAGAPALSTVHRPFPQCHLRDGAFNAASFAQATTDYASAIADVTKRAGYPVA